MQVMASVFYQQRVIFVVTITALQWIVDSRTFLSINTVCVLVLLSKLCPRVVCAVQPPGCSGCGTVQLCWWLWMSLWLCIPEPVCFVPVPAAPSSQRVNPGTAACSPSVSHCMDPAPS